MATTGPVNYITIEALEKQLGQHKLQNFIKRCEVDFLNKVSSIAYDLTWDPSVRAVFISGPSSSGKSTLCHRLAAAFHMNGRPTLTISLDDYYMEQWVPRVINHRPDYESLDALDVELMHQQINDLLEGKYVVLPTFDFKSRTRAYHDSRRVRMNPRAILIVEGLHGLHPAISDRLPRESYYGIMIMPWAALGEDHTLLSPADLRKIRRISRDVRQRSTSALATLDYWPMLDESDRADFPMYLERADTFIDTALSYELCVTPALAAEAIQLDLDLLANDKLPPSNHTDGTVAYADLPAAVEEGKRLISVAERLPVISPQNVPEHSILTEFIS